jgi:small subunit ribosomal protein S18
MENNTQRIRRCNICQRGVLVVDYKDTRVLKKFIANNGKILPRRQSNLCAKHQKMVSNAIKNARIMGLLPFVKE